MSLLSFKTAAGEGQNQLNTGNFLWFNVIISLGSYHHCEEDMIIPVLLINLRFRKVKTLV